MTRKANALQAALSQSSRRKPTPAPVEGAENGEATPAAPAGRAPSRAGKVNVSAWLSPDYKRSLRMVQARTDKKLEPLLAEALNDLFAKYDVPQVRED